MLSYGAAGKVLTSNGQAAPSWQDVTLTSTLPVSKGGTGATTLTGVLIGNGTSQFTTKTAPSGALVGTTDIQTLSNKTLASDVQFAEPLSVQYGGTGTNTFAAGILRANGTSDFTTVTQPSGDLVGTTASQTLTNKILGSGTSFLDPLTVSNGGTGVNTITGYVKGNGTSAMSAVTTIPVTDISGTIPVSRGGTGTTTFTTGILKASGTNDFITVPAPTGDLVGTTDTQTLTNKILTGCTGLPLTTGVTGILPIANGGTGTTTGAVGADLTSATGILPVTKGGTGFVAAPRGEIYLSTESEINDLYLDGSTYRPIPFSGTITHNVGITVGATTVQYPVFDPITQTVINETRDTFCIKNTSGSARVFLVTASFTLKRDQFLTDYNQTYGIKLFSGTSGSLTAVVGSESLGVISGIDYLQEMWGTVNITKLVTLVNNAELAVYIADLSGNLNQVFINKASLTAVAII